VESGNSSIRLSTQGAATHARYDGRFRVRKPASITASATWPRWGLRTISVSTRVATGELPQQRGNHDRNQRWDRTPRAALFEQDVDLNAQGISERQAAKLLAVPHSTLQAWQVYQERLDAHPAMVAFLHSPPGLAFLYRLALALHLGCCEVGAGGIRLVGLRVEITGLDRFVGSSSGTQHQVNRRVAEAMVASCQHESARLAQEMPQKTSRWHRMKRWQVVFAW
jgi:hypothetical protein